MEIGRDPFVCVLLLDKESHSRDSSKLLSLSF